MDDKKKALLRATGHGDKVDRIEQGLCPLCAEPVKREDLRDDLSKREFDIAGMCQACQDDFFGDGTIETDVGTCKRPKKLEEYLRADD